MTTEMLGVIGFVATVVLGLNAYFLKELVDSINQVKIQTAKLLTRSEEVDRRIIENKGDIDMVRSRQHSFANDVAAKLLELEIKLTELKK